MLTWKDLPANVRRWLEHAVPAEFSMPARIINTQQGEINIRDSWTAFHAATSYQADPFAFEWQARIRPLPLVWLQARDYHADSAGGGSTRLWGVFSMGGRQDPTAYRMQVVRSLAELPWMPPFALVISGLQWQDQGAMGFTLRCSLTDPEIQLDFELNQAGDVVRVQGQRHYDTPQGYELAPWQIAYDGHRLAAGLRVPGQASAYYEKPDGRWEYWRAGLTDLRLEY